MAAHTHGNRDTHTSHYHITPIAVYNSTCAHGKHLVRIPTSTYSTDYRKHYYNAATVPALTEVDDLGSRAVNYTNEPPVLKILPCETLPERTLLPTMIPSTPVALPATDITYQSFTANWEPVANVVTYLLHYAVNTGSQSEPVWGTYVTVNVGNVTSFSLTGLLRAEEYLYHVHASNLEYVTEESNSIQVQTTHGMTLYNWYAAAKNGGTGIGSIAPAGWHVPTDAEWTTLTDYLVANGYGFGGSGVDIGKAMATDSNWFASAVPGEVGNDQASNNDSGFSIPPDGYRTTTFNGSGGVCGYWALDEWDASNAWRRYIAYNHDYFERNWDFKFYGFSLRLLKDDSTDPGTVTDYDSNVYPTIKIDTQVWMAENLITEHFNNGDAIPIVTGDTAWAALTTPARCWYTTPL